MNGEWALPDLTGIEAAAGVVYRSMPPTPQYRWPLVEAQAGTEVWVKHENHTPAGAFKVRGGLVLMDHLAHTRPDIRGVVSATRGNHGQSIGFATRGTGLRAVIVVPHGNSRDKNAAMRALGVELIEHGEDFQAASDHAGELAAREGLFRIPNIGAEIVAGVATYTLEFLRGTPPLDTVYVPIGMGSGACAMIAARDALGLRTEIVGVVSREAPAYLLSFEAGHVVEHPASTVLADGLACRRPDATALEHLRRGLARVVAVDEAEVAAAMRGLFLGTHNVAEGAGAAAYAALLKERDRQRGRRVGVTLCGGNVDADVFVRVLSGG